jgi:hypothetical protein
MGNVFPEDIQKLRKGRIGAIVKDKRSMARSIAT